MVWRTEFGNISVTLQLLIHDGSQACANNRTLFLYTRMIVVTPDLLFYPILFLHFSLFLPLVLSPMILTIS